MEGFSQIEAFLDEDSFEGQVRLVYIHSICRKLDNIQSFLVLLTSPIFGTKYIYLYHIRIFPFVKLFLKFFALL